MKHWRAPMTTKQEPATATAMDLVVVRSLALSILATLAILYTLYLASPILIPITLALYLNLLFSPVVNLLTRIHIPLVISAALIVSGFVFVIGLTTSLLIEPAQEWLREAPTSIESLRDSMATAQKPLQDIQEVSEQVEKMTKIGDEPDTPKVSVEKPTFLNKVASNVPTLLAYVGIAVFLTFFLLASGDTFLLKFTRLGRNFTEQRRIVTVIRHIQSDISRYLLTITIINIALGLAVTGTMYLLEVPNPWLWGTLAGLLNFVPYVGPFLTIVILTFVGLTTFPEVSRALSLPLIYFGLTALEGQVVTPLVVGQRLKLSPVMVFISLVLWGWLWGPVGMLLAVPILVSLNVILQNVPRLTALSVFMKR